MCGIAGIAGLRGASPDTDRVRRMVDAIRHRGPDEDAVDLENGVALGIARLSIIDVEGGQQPVFNEDRSVRAVFNGEIYNYREIRTELRARGHTFRSESDSEVIVHAYEEYGADFLSHLNGMFAIAVHDSRTGRLMLVRDPVGIKPLYYSLTPDYLIWGSEVKCILTSGLVDRSLDMNAVSDFLAWEYVPGPATLMRAIQKMEAGTVMDVDLRTGTVEISSYWDVEDVAAARHWSDSEWEQKIEEQIATSTRMQMVSDVPLGAFLSGGVDSSLIAASMGSAHTFSIGFDDPSYNELPYARKVAHHLGLEFSEQIIRDDVADLFWDLTYHLDDPIGDFSIFPTYLVSRLARQDVKVVLSGDGADEIFGGYETYAANNVARYYQRIPSFIRRSLVESWVGALKPRQAKKGVVNKAKRFVEGTTENPYLSHTRWRLFAGDAVVNELLSVEAALARDRSIDEHVRRHHESATRFPPVSEMLYVDFKTYLCDNILTKVDRMSMAVSLEARVPYLDTDLVNLAFSMPDHLKVKGTSTKVLLKKLAAKRVPRECVYRPKEGFSIPIKNWLGTNFQPVMEEFLGDDRLADDQILRGDTVARLKREHLSGEANHSHILWSLIVLQAWRKRWLNDT